MLALMCTSRPDFVLGGGRVPPVYIIVRLAHGWVCMRVPMGRSASN